MHLFIYSRRMHVIHGLQQKSELINGEMEAVSMTALFKCFSWVYSKFVPTLRTSQKQIRIYISDAANGEISRPTGKFQWLDITACFISSSKQWGLLFSHRRLKEHILEDFCSGIFKYVVGIFKCFLHLPAEVMRNRSHYLTWERHLYHCLTL